MICDGCHQETWGVSILGIMPHTRKEGRPAARLCNNCTDTCPCGCKGWWSDGHITCKHGYVYDLDYHWVDASNYRENANKARPIFDFLKRRWWSYLIVSNSEHAKYTTNAI
jgi:hypothetical protein